MCVDPRGIVYLVESGRRRHPSADASSAARWLRPLRSSNKPACADSRHWTTPWKKKAPVVDISFTSVCVCVCVSVKRANAWLGVSDRNAARGPKQLSWTRWLGQTLLLFRVRTAGRYLSACWPDFCSTSKSRQQQHNILHRVSFFYFRTQNRTKKITTKSKRARAVCLVFFFHRVFFSGAPNDVSGCGWFFMLWRLPVQSTQAIQRIGTHQEICQYQLPLLRWLE